jgi:nucleotide-binding universal stress UspA family protein
MYRHILIPTDGSKAAEHGVAHGLALAKSLGAKVSVIFVVEPFSEMSGRFARNRPRAWIARQTRPGRLVFPARRSKWRTGNPIKPSSQQPRTKAAISLLCHRMGAADFPCF